MYVVQGQKLKGNSFKWYYEDLNIAKFEFLITKCVSSFIVISKENEGLYEQLDLYVRG